MAAPPAPGVEWLLESSEPAIRVMARRDLLGEQVEVVTEELLAGPMVSALLSGQQPDGGFGNHPYRKWTGVHWRLVSLVELGVPPLEPHTVAAAERVLEWLATMHRHPGHSVTIAGRVRACASMEGNALAACCRVGMAADPRARRTAEALIEWQWPDGGWNCDRSPTAHRSSFHESLATAWGLHEYALATGDREARAAAGRTAELILEHRLFRTLAEGDVIDKAWLRLRYPPYWHYDVLQALLVLSRMGKVRDVRAAEALDEVEHRRLPHGRWAAQGRWWRAPTSPNTPEVVDWGTSGEPNQMLTLNALRVLQAAGRLS